PYGYDFNRSFEYGRPYGYDFNRSFEYGRPYGYDTTRSFELGRPYGSTEIRPQEFGYGRQFEAGMPYFRPTETMRPMENMPTMGGDTFMVPAVNSAETPDAYLLVVELPGVDLKDVNLQIHGSSLVLNAFRRPTWSNGTITVNYHFAEGRFGTLRRMLPLPTGVLPGQIQANFVNGLLTIVLPKTVNGANALPQASIVINSNVPTTM
ncbi:MAG TPA: Hsp20/alpha crystallin family protein, partial [Stenomitos sp.]